MTKKNFNTVFGDAFYTMSLVGYAYNKSAIALWVAIFFSALCALSTLGVHLSLRQQNQFLDQFVQNEKDDKIYPVWGGIAISVVDGIIALYAHLWLLPIIFAWTEYVQYRIRKLANAEPGTPLSKETSA